MTDITIDGSDADILNILQTVYEEVEDVEEGENMEIEEEYEVTDNTNDVSYDYDEFSNIHPTLYDEEEDVEEVEVVEEGEFTDEEGEIVESEVEENEVTDKPYPYDVILSILQTLYEEGGEDQVGEVVEETDNNDDASNTRLDLLNKIPQSPSTTKAPSKRFAFLLTKPPPAATTTTRTTSTTTTTPPPPTKTKHSTTTTASSDTTTNPPVVVSVVTILVAVAAVLGLELALQYALISGLEWLSPRARSTTAAGSRARVGSQPGYEQHHSNQPDYRYYKR